jgi:hypothetical protein
MTAPFGLSPARGLSGKYRLDPTSFRPVPTYGTESDALAYWQLGNTVDSLIDLTPNAKPLRRHIAGATVTAGGSGYTSTPAAAIAPAGKLGSIVPVLTAGAVLSLVVKAPGYYDTAPSLTITGGGGAGATGTPIFSTAPTFDANGMVTAEDACSGLTTDILDSATGFEYAVVQWPELSNLNRMVFGSLVNGDNTGAAAYFTSTGILTCLTRGIASLDTFARPAGVSPGDWVFVGLAHDGVNRTFYLGGSAPQVRSGVKPVSAAWTRGVGNTLYTPASYNAGLRFRGYSVLPSKAIAQMDAIYAREKNRMLSLGINLK